MEKEKERAVYNIFIEGIQGTGKSTLLQAIAEKRPDMHVCREGDYSPVELAWCSWMTEEEYRAAGERYPSLKKELEANAFREGDRRIVTYTRILTEIPGFHKDLERFEIYNGRKSVEELEEIVRMRYRRFSETGYLFECAFLQNIVEDLILYHRLSEDEIVAFYRRLYGQVQKENFRLLYLYGDKLEESTEIIRKERCDSGGREMWYPLMLKYLTESPYGRERGCSGFEDLVMHFRHRQQVELRILREVVGEQAVILPSKGWKKEELTGLLSGR
ncbi:hypothetical protein NSB25_24790 [Acetatifactor muris]|uniref:Thymidylate kinase n=1 Tax=Acetatifactor muris TaxID=879566 RepID=A0A2K4ZNR0_9FIRM|nr:hypothetical protein [Acetatifactor muris]MCI8798355.1 hypothetical protein [Lachnospiraceae bacterium]MCR2050457.1 hypothetical protein [Acetatifactor muris]SOY32085.1 hypothetical protein AMURIS_04838 [Acetatifactor muris]